MAEKEYIERCTDCLHYKPCKEWSIVCFGDDNTFPYEAPKNLCEHFMPTIDVVELVRCKDCKFFMEYPEKCADIVEHADGECWRKYFYSHNAQFSACEYNDFCSQGKRKDGERK